MSICLALWLTLAPVLPPPPPPFPQAQPKPAPAVPLSITKVLREGPPPYEGDDRLYQLEGDGVDQLLPGDILQLRRGHEDLIMPRLEVTVVLPDHALARAIFQGETFPLTGDLASPRGVAQGLPELPALQDAPAGSALPALQPATPSLKAPEPLGGFTPKQESLYFVPGESRITPAGKTKLQAWVQAWGPSHRWFIACPPWPGEAVDLNSARLTVLKEELKRLGVNQPDVRILLGQTPGPYPLVYIGADPW